VAGSPAVLLTIVLQALHMDPLFSILLALFPGDIQSGQGFSKNESKGTFVVRDLFVS
jgi:hypothetical protein